MAFPSAAAMAAIAGCCGRCGGVFFQSRVKHFTSLAQEATTHAISCVVQDYQGCFLLHVNVIVPLCC